MVKFSFTISINLAYTTHQNIYHKIFEIKFMNYALKLNIKVTLSGLIFRVWVCKVY